MKDQTFWQYTIKALLRVLAPKREWRAETAPPMRCQWGAYKNHQSSLSLPSAAPAAGIITGRSDLVPLLSANCGFPNAIICGRALGNKRQCSMHWKKSEEWWRWSDLNHAHVAKSTRQILLRWNGLMDIPNVPCLINLLSGRASRASSSKLRPLWWRS